MKNVSPGVLLLAAVLLILVGYAIGLKRGKAEGYRNGRREGYEDAPKDVEYIKERCPEPDASKWVLKATVPPCPPLPDMSKYMLKTECPPQPDMSKYVLKTSVPACPPCISTCSKPCKIGGCPPCPRPRCPTMSCPDPKPCPACPAVQVQSCPEPNIQCNAKYDDANKVRPMLASTSTFGF
jgi:hypothetical protein